jgi:hypothetical protein
MIGIRSLLRFKTTYSKKDLGKIFKNMNRDTKQLFGDLLETNKIRKKRLKSTDGSHAVKVERVNDNVDRLKLKIKPIAKGNIYVYKCCGFVFIDTMYM